MKVSIKTVPQKRVRTIGIGQPSKLANLTDVDVSDLDDGESLIWDNVLQKFIIKMPDINGGSF